MAFMLMHWAASIQELMGAFFFFWAIERWLARRHVWAFVLAVMSIFSKMAGMPYAEANATMKIIGVVILFIITAFAIPLSNAVIDAVMAYHSSESIRIPGP